MSENDNEFTVRFWGVRGTVPCPGGSTLRYGGNTSCIEFRCGGRRLIIDAGTGIRALGLDLIESRETVQTDILLTHTHLDHIAGLPFFKPLYLEGNAIKLWNGHLVGQQRSLRDVLATIMEEPFFPVPLDVMKARLEFCDFRAGDTLDTQPCLRIRTAPLNHPGGATAYRVEYDNRSACVITDTEHVPGKLDDNILQLIDGSDLVIYDTSYTEEEFPNYIGWGHSTWQHGLRLAAEAGVDRFACFHHQPGRDDNALDRIGLDISRQNARAFVAREGLVVSV